MVDIEKLVNKSVKKQIQIPDDKISQEEYNKARILDYTNDIGLRKFYSIGFFILICLIIACSYTIIFLIGFEKLHFEIPVILELFPLIFTNIIAIILVIVRYLFRDGRTYEKKINDEKYTFPLLSQSNKQE